MIYQLSLSFIWISIHIFVFLSRVIYIIFIFHFYFLKFDVRILKKHQLHKVIVFLWRKWNIR